MDVKINDFLYLKFDLTGIRKVLFFNRYMFGVWKLNIIAKKKTKTRYWDAESGESVKKDYAEKNPKAIVKETDKVKQKIINRLRTNGRKKNKRGRML